MSIRPEDLILHPIEISDVTRRLVHPCCDVATGAGAAPFFAHGMVDFHPSVALQDDAESAGRQMRAPVRHGGALAAALFCRKGWS